MRRTLWPERWPAIALQVCVDKVAAAPTAERPRVVLELPCQDCEKNSACLTAKRKELGSLLYDREMQTAPRSSESSLFPRELFEPMLRKDQALVPYWHKPFMVESRYAVVQAWDIAWSEKIGGDWLVCMTAYLDRDTGRRHMLDIERWQKVTFPEQCRLIEAKWGTYAADLVVIESDASQMVWRQHMTRNTSVPVIAHGSSKKTDFAVGVPGLLIMLENRKWEFPYERGSWHWEHTQTFLAEAEAFGWVDGHLQGVGEHDDTVMAWWHLNWGLDRFAVESAGGRSVRRGVQPGVHI